MINGSGLSNTTDFTRTHEFSQNGGSMWLTNLVDPAEKFAIFDLGDLYDLSTAYIWNNNQLADRGVATLDILV